MTDDPDRWNHNIHYFPVVLSAVPRGATHALDVGCGEGMLARNLRQVVPQVTGIDVDEPTLRLARSHSVDDGVTYICGDVLTHPLGAGSFDFISAVAVLHHMDEAAALHRLRDLLRPGGTLAIIGLARHRLPADLPFELAGAVATRAHKLTRTYWETPAPKVWPPPHTFAEIRDLSERILPGRTYRRHVLWRYTVTWTKPRSDRTLPAS